VVFFDLDRCQVILAVEELTGLPEKQQSDDVPDGPGKLCRWQGLNKGFQDVAYGRLKDPARLWTIGMNQGLLAWMKP
jgi:hypothetical protein